MAWILKMDDLDVAFLILRLIVGAFQIPHGAMKLGLFGADAHKIAANFEGYGLRPGRVWVTAVGAAQVILGFMITFGVETEIAASITSCMSFAMAVIALRPSGWFWNRHGMEYAVFWGFAAFCLVLTGPGRLSIDAFLHVAER
jgi:putative oxidoreductase